jgi:hypothetical protein
MQAHWGINLKHVNDGQVHENLLGEYECRQFLSLLRNG